MPTGKVRILNSEAQDLFSANIDYSAHSNSIRVQG
jgi:hypothetical protein